MRNFLLFTAITSILVWSCNEKTTTATEIKDSLPKNFQAEISGNRLSDGLIIPEGKVIKTRFKPPEGFTRYTPDSNSYAFYLQHLPLKANGSSVLLFNGVEKVNYDVYCGVVDLPIGNKNLHQCADAIMRLRAEYLWTQKQYDKIHFNFTNGFRVDYTPWMNGKRIKVIDAKCFWDDAKKTSNTYNDFWAYMETIFNYCGTLSLSKELQHVSINNMQIGDVFIQGGSPGHAIVVVDMAVNNKTGKKVFMLAQSYMPAQETQILVNRQNKDLSPWYPLNFGDDLYTPEWHFSKNDLMRFSE